MAALITPIILPLPLGMGSVNCYLIQAGGGYVLVDTGAPNARARLRTALEEAGCLPGKLGLILLTHGDFDHMGNAAHVRRAYGSPIGMHVDDVCMAETGDMFANRSRSNTLLRILAPKLIGFGRAERFAPDMLLEDGRALAEYGLDARVISLPGHSKGSIGILTADGDFLCGDLLENTERPRAGSVVDDQEATLASLARLGRLSIRRIHPGHGQPFLPEQLADTGISTEVHA